MIRKKFKIYLSGSALNDLHALAGFYKKLMFHLAKGLVIELNETLSRLQSNPASFGQGYDGKFGVINLRKYPVEIYYTIDGHSIIILSFEHKNHTINKWIERV